MNRKARRAASKAVPLDQPFLDAYKIHMAGDFDQAEQRYRAIIKTDDRHLNATLFLAMICAHKGKTEEGLALYDRACNKLATGVQGMGPPWNNYAAALAAAGKLDEARDAYLKAISLGAGPLAMSNLAGIYKDMGLFEESIQWHERAWGYCRTNGCREFETIENNMLSSYAFGGILSDSADLKVRSQEWVDRYAYHGAVYPRPPDLSPGKRLTVGFVSADFREHTIMFVFESVLAALSQLNDEIEVVLVSNLEAAPDAFTERLQGYERIVIEHDTDEEATRKIRNRGIDILIDLSYRTLGNRLLMFAHRPAPIQVAYLGAVATSGLPEMDYLIADKVLIPPNSREVFTEEIIRLPGCWQAWTPPIDAPDVAPPPSTLGRPFTFGSFNGRQKLFFPTFDLWARVLREIPDSRLVLKYNASRSVTGEQRIRGEFEARGIDPSRITTLHATDTRVQHLECYAQMDVALDTTPMSSGQTGADALWMGVPLIGYAGDRLIGRISASMMTAMGFAIDVAKTPDEFLEIAHRYAMMSPDALSRCRYWQRQKIMESRYCDAHAVARELADAFRKMWHRYVGGPS